MSYTEAARRSASPLAPLPPSGIPPPMDQLAQSPEMTFPGRHAGVLGGHFPRPPCRRVSVATVPAKPNPEGGPVLGLCAPSSPQDPVAGSLGLLRLREAE